MFARAGSDGPPGSDPARASSSPRDGSAREHEEEARRATERDPRDEALVVGIRRGDEEAFARAFRTHVTPLVRYARRFVSTEAAAQDVVMDVFLRLWRDRATMPADLPLVRC